MAKVHSLRLGLAGLGFSNRWKVNPESPERPSTDAFLSSYLRVPVLGLLHCLGNEYFRGLSFA